MLNAHSVKLIERKKEKRKKEIQNERMKEPQMMMFSQM
jgi:hypothetical protein